MNRLVRMRNATTPGLRPPAGLMPGNANLPIGILLASCGLLLLVSCATSPMVPREAKQPIPTSAFPVTVKPGDVMEVKFRYWPDLDETQMVRVDGKIALQLINEVDVTGLMPQELQEKLEVLYASRLKDPEITVLVRKELQHYVYVGGEVLMPGRKEFLNSMTPMEAVMSANGLLRSAKLSNVLIVRRIGDKEYGRTLDLRPVFREAERNSFLLEPNDVIYVPKTKIARAGDWVDMNINNLMPYGVGFLDVIGANKVSVPNKAISVGTSGVNATFSP